MTGHGGKRPGAGRPPGSTTERTEALYVRATADELDVWRTAADKRGESLSEWVRGVLDRSARRTR